ncbi:Histone-lysine N-methyltransferase SETMAR [Eumeta japonica]|uniref:Histone-lysine N-methyltransferase SETMAR n=1 Tax=Eumeta variegata TaxID=151549 RepID=A0A4C1TEQ9_EUMVA|nr:Histone-lysine N-methyltransferase SETMAR [Eumeta japonica]
MAPHCGGASYEIAVVEAVAEVSGTEAVEMAVVRTREGDSTGADGAIGIRGTLNEKVTITKGILRIGKVLANKPRRRPETLVDDEELKAIVEEHPSQTTSELAEGFDVNDKTIFIHLKQIGKEKKTREMGTA